MAELADDLVIDQDTRLDQAEGIVRRYCGWHIAPSRAGETYTLPEASPVILLPTLHLTAVTAAMGADDADLLTYGFTFSADGILRRGSLAPDGIAYWGAWWPAGTVVTFTHGYSTVPPDVTAVVQALAQRATDNPGSRTQITDGPFSESYSLTGTGEAVGLSLLMGDKATLDLYKLPPRP